jgi:hypothetical protein
MRTLECSSSILETNAAGPVLEVAFRGLHDWEHGRTMDAYIRERVDAELPAAIVINLLEYDYEFGNDLAGLFAAWLHPSGRVRPVCIAAHGRTLRCLKSLFQGAGVILPFPVRFAESRGAALSEVSSEVKGGAS